MGSNVKNRPEVDSTLRSYQDWPLPTGQLDFPLDFLLEEVRAIGRKNKVPWDLNPDYQRGLVWTDSQASRFIGHLITGGPVPPIYIQRYETDENLPEGVSWLDAAAEVIDGQQRIRATLRWLEGVIPAEMDDGKAFWFRDLSLRDVRRLPNVHVSFVDLSRKERLRFYLRLNSGGTIHTTEEIQRVQELLLAEENK